MLAAAHDDATLVCRVLGERGQESTASTGVTISVVVDSWQFHLVGVDLPINDELFLLPFIEALDVTVILQIRTGSLL